MAKSNFHQLSDAAQIYYLKLHKYKYQLMDEYKVEIDIKPYIDIDYNYVSLTSKGCLTIREHYAWDGPFRPMINTKNFMRGSLVHDALYQLMRVNALDHKIYRKRADEILRKICIEDGMCSFRAWYVYHAVHLFAKGGACPRGEPKMKDQWRRWNNLSESEYEQDIVESILHILKTPRGSIETRPYFGSDILYLVYEPLNASNKRWLESSVTQGLNKWEPRIEIKSVNISHGEESQLLIDIQYRTRTTSALHALRYSHDLHNI